MAFDCFPRCHCGERAKDRCSKCETWFCASHGQIGSQHTDYQGGEYIISRSPVAGDGRRLAMSKVKQERATY